MDGYGKNGMIREMEYVVLRMKSNQCKPDIITFNLLIDCYGKKHGTSFQETVALLGKTNFSHIQFYDNKVWEGTYER